MVAVRARAALAAAIALLVLLAPVDSGAQKSKGDVHKPPYKAGPTGGDEFNYIHTDRQEGSIFIGRLFPGIPPVVGCAPEPSAGWAMFHLEHTVRDPVSSITLDYEGSTDAYSWITVGARDSGGRWLGVKKLQGPVAGSGELTVRLFDRPAPGQKMTIEFGLQLGDACPQAGWAAATFPKVTVR